MLSPVSVSLSHSHPLINSLTRPGSPLSQSTSVIMYESNLVLHPPRASPPSPSSSLTLLSSQPVVFAFTRSLPLRPFILFFFHIKSHFAIFHSLHKEHCSWISFLISFPLFSFHTPTSLAPPLYPPPNNNPSELPKQETQGTHPSAESANAILSGIRPRLVSLMYLS